MPPAIELFGTAVLVLGLTALGLSVIFEASRLSAVAGKQALVRRRLQARERETADQKKRLDTAEADVLAKQASLDGLMAERTRVLAATTALKLSKIEMVHEIGEPEPGALLFQGDLRVNGDAVRASQRRIVFAREIWERNNTVHVWAENPDSAMAAIQRAFNARSGIVATRVQRVGTARPDGRGDGMPAGSAVADRPAEDRAPGDRPAGDHSTGRPALRVAAVAKAA